MPPISLRDEEGQRVRSAAGLLISRAAKGDVHAFIQRTTNELSVNQRDNLVTASKEAHERIGLPSRLLSTNWTVDPFGLRRLFDNMLEKIRKGEVDDLIPANPHNTGSKKHYSSIFLRIQRYVFQTESAFGAVGASTAVDWMTGIPYPRLACDRCIRRKRNEQTRSPRMKRPKPRTPLPRFGHRLR
ncbi:hypothetical protein SAMN05216228_10343 [Rhizobium tibeticum]|uniref:Uncharacterized protein n=1 Tax=Rhizobium tibeticum TaxID=501024 RepID=A0A1H8UFU5_9HYPH|nr:hypothetical protein RTCCBAU85039_5640 [Rhizobium tibeticum]SEP02099.1 hypothetical protein SAMN05216228_10343 [Rhizobium tibeticum]